MIDRADRYAEKSVTPTTRGDLGGKMWRKVQRAPSVAVLIVVGYALLWAVPMGVFVWFFLESPKDAFLGSGSFWRLLWNSSLQGVLSALLSLIVAIPGAFYIAYRKDWFSRVLEGLMVIPFFFPVISTVIACTLLFQSSFWGDIQILYTLKAILIANVFYNAPLFMKYLGEGMRHIPKECIESAELQGVGRVRLFCSVIVPLLRPQLFRAFFLVFTYSFTSLILVLSLGGLSYATLEVEIALTLRGGYNFSRVLWLGFVQTLVLLLVHLTGDRVQEYELLGEPACRPLSLVTRCGAVLFFLFEVIIGVTGCVYAFVNPMSGAFSLQGLREIFSVDFNQHYPVIRSIGNSLFLGGVGAFFSVGIGYLLLRYSSRWSNRIVFFTMGFSTAFLGITLIFLHILWGVPLALLLVVGYTLITVPVAYSFLYPYIRKFPRIIEEASMLDGAGFFARLRYIYLPLLRPVLISVYLQVVAIICGEFTLGYTMQLGKSLPTVALTANSLFSSKQFVQGAALNGCMLLIVSFLFILGKILENKQFRGIKRGRE